MDNIYNEITIVLISHKSKKKVLRFIKNYSLKFKVIVVENSNEKVIEEEIKGREISVGVINLKGTITSLPPTEIISHNDFFDYDAKYNGESDEITPAELELELENRVREISLDIYKKLNLKGFSRCDFILRDNRFYFLEVNTNPGLTKESILPQMAKAEGISLRDLFRSVID